MKKKIMSATRFITKFRLTESLKELRLNQILDKISGKKELSKSEQGFLNNYDNVTDSDYSDYKLLSKDTTYNKLGELLDKNLIIICNIGRHQKKIIDIENFNDTYCVIHLEGGGSTRISDNFLYNIIYSMDDDTYSLEIEDEYFEKNPVSNK